MSSPSLNLKKSILRNMNLGENKSSSNIENNEERVNRSAAKDENFKNTMLNKHNAELKYTKQKKRILKK